MPISQDGNCSLTSGSQIHKVPFPVPNIAEVPIEGQGEKLFSPG